MTNHGTDKCNKLQKDIKNIERVKHDNQINKVDQNNSDGNNAHSSKT